MSLAAHDPDWAVAYMDEAAVLHSILGERRHRLAHVGSTAIPGIMAKPIIDIAMELADVPTIETVTQSLAENGYTYFGDRKGIGDYFLAKGTEDNRTHYLHASIRDSRRFDMLVYFRDRLRWDTQLAKSYERLKLSLSREHKECRREYTRKKEIFIDAVMKAFSGSAV